MCGFDGGTASVSVWFDGGAAGVGAVGFVFRWVCSAGVGVVETVGKKKRKKK